VEELVVWFVIQSLVVIVPAFLLGILVGWSWWQRRKVQFSQSEAVTALTSRHHAALGAKQDELDRSGRALSEKDLEIGRLSTLVSGDTLELAAQHERELSLKDEQIAELTAHLQVRDTQLGARTAELASRAAELESRDAEIGRLATLIDEAENAAAAHSDELATRDGRLAEQEAALSDRDAEISRLSAALNAAMSTAAGDAAPAPHLGDQADASTDATAPPEPAAPVPADGVADLPEIDESPREDDLERVEGIGPRIGSALRDAGILTFKDLAAADTATLQAALEKAGLRFAPSLPTWSRQAALLAEGDEAGFMALTERLVAGRDVPGTR
jgi:predicted flap endonuclease-1-like 5' DNA nuclease